MSTKTYTEIPDEQTKRIKIEKKKKIQLDQPASKSRRFSATP
jgi:hypothetical protein